MNFFIKKKKKKKKNQIKSNLNAISLTRREKQSCYKIAYLELCHTDPKIRFIELIRDVPTKRTKLSSLLGQGMEETQTE